MALLQKLEGGKIFEDLFSSTTLNPAWEQSVTDATRFSLSERAGYLRLKHGDTSYSLMMDMPNRDCVFEIGVDYNPQIQLDTGGIIVFRDVDTNVQLVNYFNPTSPTIYQKMRLVKSGDEYAGYGSKTNGATWELIGTTSLENMHKLGLTINGKVETNSVPMDVDYVRIYGSTQCSVNNMTPGMKARLYNSGGTLLSTVTCLAGMDTVSFDLTTMSIPFIGKIEVEDLAGTKYPLSNQEIWGGDIFWYGSLIELTHNGVPINVVDETKLGSMVNGRIEAKITMRNPSSEMIPHVIVTPQLYFDYVGGDWVKIAEDVGGIPGDVKDSLSIDFVLPGGIREFWLIITKPYALPYTVASHKFMLNIENG